MKSFFTKELLTHPMVLAAVGTVCVVGIGSAIYYFEATKLPSNTFGVPVVGTIEEVVTGSGTVVPAQNPDLAFESGGRIAVLSVAVSSHVSQGEVLASLDTDTLEAQRAQAAADVTSEQAQLAQMQAGPRAVDVDIKQTAVAQANTALQNFYASVDSNIEQAYDESSSGVSSTDTLFAQPYSPSPSLAFSTSNSQASLNVVSNRTAANAELAGWLGEINTLSSTASTASLDAELASSLMHLSVLRTYANALLQTLTNATPSGTFPQSAVTAAQTSVGALRDTVNRLILSLQGQQQQAATDKLAVQSAEDALNQTLAGSTPQDIEAQQAQVEAAQAQVENVDAQIRNAQVVAPFAGTVSSVHVKQGDTIAPGTVAISLEPQNALQAEVYVSAVDAAKLQVGNEAQITLDAYGPSREFDASVVSIDQSPTTQNGVPGYKVVLQFSAADPSITPGMTANATIIAAQKQNALIIPLSAVIQNGTQSFVLVPSGSGTTQRQIETGIIGTNTVEVTAGLSASDQFLINSQ